MVRRRDVDEETRKFGERAAASDDASSRKERMRPPSFSQVLSHSWSRNETSGHSRQQFKKPLLTPPLRPPPLLPPSLPHLERATTPFYAKGEFPLCHAAMATTEEQVVAVGIYPWLLCDENMSMMKPSVNFHGQNYQGKGGTRDIALIKFSRNVYEHSVAY